ncbi:MAG TPA: ATP-grasp domain-containing protein, partial [Elusimicrobiota bacterium]|nr:ATP-grasp domain-containing protein [Elusimicrobiota bacterium]
PEGTALAARESSTDVPAPADTRPAPREPARAADTAASSSTPESRQDERPASDSSSLAPLLDKRGPLYRIHSGAAPDGALGSLYDGAGKTILLVGAASSGRDFLLDEPLRVARELGMRLVLVEEPANRPPAEKLAEADFIPAPLNDSRPEAVQAVVDAVARFAESSPIHGVAVFYHDFVETAAKITDALRRREPAVPGNSYEAVRGANDKALAREKLAAAAPEVSAPFERVTSAEAAAAAFARVTGGRPGAKVVLKPVVGAAKIGVRTDIASPEEARRAFQGMADIQTRGRAGASAQEWVLSQSAFAGYMMELQLEGPEVDVEIVLGDGDGLAMVQDNPPADAPHKGEKGYTAPSRLPEGRQRELIRAALKALAALGLTRGNFHVEMILTPDGPKLVEVNPRMGGGNTWPLYMKLSGLSLIEQGMRAAVGAPLAAPGRANYAVIESRKIRPRYSGEIVSIEGAEDVARLADVVGFHLGVKPGDRIATPEDADEDQIFGYLMAAGDSHDAAWEHAKDALSRLRISIRGDDGVVRVQSGLYSHDPAGDWTPEEAHRIWEGYFRAEMGVSVIIALYYPLFGVVMRTLGGVAGTGRGRLGYAGALGLSGPFVGALVEHLPVRKVLVAALASRVLIWSALIPLSLLALGPGSIFSAVLFGLMALDGVVVAFNTLVNLDMVGMNLIAKQYGLPIDPALRNRYNARDEAFKSWSRIVFPILVALLSIAAASLLGSVAWGLVAIMALAFALPAAWAIYHYLRYLPAPPARPRGEGAIARELSLAWKTFKEGLVVVRDDVRVRTAILAFTLEQSIEDALPLVILDLFAAKVLAAALGTGAAWAALYTALLYAVGKLGAVAASRWMRERWKAPADEADERRAYGMIFPFTFLATAALLLLPVANALSSAGYLWTAVLLAAGASVLFNALLTPARLGSRHFRQELLLRLGVSARVTGFSKLAVKGFNAAFIFALSALFVALSLSSALWVSAAVMIGLVLALWAFAPQRMFPRR